MYEGLKEIAHKIRALQSIQNSMDTVRPLLAELQSPQVMAVLNQTLQELSAFNPKLLSPEEAQELLDLQAPSQLLVHLSQTYPFVQLFIPQEWFQLTGKIVLITNQNYDFLKAVANLEIVNEDSADFHQFLIDYALEAIASSPRVASGKRFRNIIAFD